LASVALFAPALPLREYRDERLRLPLFVSCSAMAAHCWFRGAK